MDRRCPVDGGRESYSSGRILFLWRILRFWNLFRKTENESDWPPYLSLQYYFVDHGMTHFNDSCHILFQNFFNDKNEWQNRVVLADIQDRINQWVIILTHRMTHTLWLNIWWSRLKARVKAEKIINGFHQKGQYQVWFQKINHFKAKRCRKWTGFKRKGSK